ncbi:hypothetical protein BH10ACT11_BH10ACT11_01430 [soil metagenome]
MSRARIGLAVLAICVALAIFLIARGDDDANLLRGNGGNSVGLSTQPGKTFTFGVPRVYNRTGRPITLRSVELADATPGMKLIGAFAAGPGKDRSAIQSLDRGLPPPASRKAMQPIDGFVVAPKGTRDGRQGAELILELKVTHPGLFRFEKIRVAYETADGGTHEQLFAHELSACAKSPPGSPPVSCRNQG